MNNPATYDVIVIGAGVVGIAVASVLSNDLRVLILERETVPMYHSTSRSAAMLIESYGGSAMEQFIRGSRPFFVNPPAGFCDAPLASPRGIVTLAKIGQEALLKQAFAGQTGSDLMSIAALQQRIPAIRAGKFTGGLLDENAMDLDVDQLCQGYLRQFKQLGGELVCGAEVKQIQRRQGLWTVGSSAGDYSAPRLINAAGAWADDVAKMAQLTGLGLLPHRRTAAIVAFEQPAGRDWPMIGDFDETWYGRPEGEWMMVSLAEETPMQACDAWPDDIDVATGIDNFQQALDLGEVTKVVRSWAGLRTFSPDRHPVVGFDPRQEGFFWLAGQGGSGIHSAPALTHAAASLITGNTFPEWLKVDTALITSLSPRRFMDK